jgi:DNA-binding NtrC family response regulator
MSLSGSSADVGNPMMQILLVGTEMPLLEGLAQSFAALGFSPTTANSLQEARDFAALHPPLVAVVSRGLAAASTADTLSIPLAPGGALVLFRSVGGALVTLSPTVQRAVLADLTLPLERNRLMALVQHVGERAKATGRGWQNELPNEASAGR